MRKKQVEKTPIKVDEYIRTVPDYPIEGVNFYDLNSLFASEVWGLCVEQFCRQVEYGNVWAPMCTHIVGIESRGFVVGQALASEMLKPFVMVRKKGSKYPGKLLEESYDTEYSTDTLVLQEGILGHTSQVLIADDLVATGGSLAATKRLIEQTGAKVIGAACVVNLNYLNTDQISDIDVRSFVNVYK